MDGKNNPIRGERPNGNEQPTNAQQHLKSSETSNFETTHPPGNNDL